MIRPMSTYNQIKDNEDCYLKSLFLSLKEVKGSYIRDNYHDPIVDFTYVERTFAYEFYYQWRHYLIKNKIENVRIDAEIPKQFVDANHDANSPYDTVYPDMVLHTGQSYPEGNIIACEFKRMINLSDSLILKDLKKLQRYVNSESEVAQSANWEPFQFGVFILIFNNINKESVENKLHTMLSSLKEEITDQIKNQDKIICCIYDGCDFYYDRLDKLIRDKEYLPI